MIEIKTREELELLKLVLPLGANVMVPQRGSAYSNPAVLALASKLIDKVDHELKKLDEAKKKESK